MYGVLLTAAIVCGLDSPRADAVGAQMMDDRIPVPSEWVLEAVQIRGDWGKCTGTLELGRGGVGKLEIEELGRIDIVSFTAKPWGLCHRIELAVIAEKLLSDKNNVYTLPSIYSFQGDKLVLCLGFDEYPTEFAGKPGAKPILLILNRKR
jgi:hypothetical protein